MPGREGGGKREREERREREGWQDRIAFAKKFSPGDKRRDGHSESSLAKVNT